MLWCRLLKVQLIFPYVIFQLQSIKANKLNSTFNNKLYKTIKDTNGSQSLVRPYGRTDRPEHQKTAETTRKQSALSERLKLTSDICQKHSLAW
jgi:hypothetical protein